MRLPPHRHLLLPLGRFIATHRQARNISQAQLASYCRLAQGTISNIEAGRCPPQQRHLDAVLTELRTPEDGAAGISLPVIRAQRYQPSKALEEARQVLAQGGVFDAAWTFVNAGAAGSWTMRCARDEVWIAERQAPLEQLLAAVGELHGGGGLEELVVLGSGLGRLTTELVRRGMECLPLASVWLIDSSPHLLAHAARAVQEAADARVPWTGRRRSGGGRRFVLGVAPLCADFRDLPTAEALFATERPTAFRRLVLLGSGVLDHAKEDWRDLSAAAVFTHAPGDLLLIEHRRAGVEDPPDPIERALADWWRIALREAARELRSEVLTNLLDAEPLQPVSAPAALGSVAAEERLVRLGGRDQPERAIRLRWRRTYEEQALDAWFAMKGLQLRGRWAFHFGNRCWALYERGAGNEEEAKGRA
jgi:transcriptional regulator with XRE-family HTH domain